MHLVRGFFGHENQLLADNLVASMTGQGKRYYQDSSDRLWLLAEVCSETMFQTKDVDHNLLKAIGKRDYKVLEATEYGAWNTPIESNTIWNIAQERSEDTQDSQSLPIGAKLATEELSSLLSRSVNDLKSVDMWEATDGNIDWLKVNGCMWIPTDHHLTHWVLRQDPFANQR